MALYGNPRRNISADNGALSTSLSILRRREAALLQPKKSTYVVEALLLFICIMMVIAVVMSLFAFASQKGAHASRTEDAVAMASNIAELFYADPSSLQDTYIEGELEATCSMALSMDSAGTLYKADISVSDSEGWLYSLEAARYVSFTGNASDSRLDAEAEETGWDF